MTTEQANASKATAVQVKSVALLDESEKLLLQEAEKSIASSIDTAKEFCKTLIGFNSGAIPIYFAVLKFLGSDITSAKSAFAPLGVLPPVLFLMSVMFLAAVLMPQRFSIRPVTLIKDYRQLRSRLFTRLWYGMIVGFGLYVVGLLLAIVAFITLIL